MKQTREAPKVRGMVNRAAILAPRNNDPNSNTQRWSETEPTAIKPRPIATTAQPRGVEVALRLDQAFANAVSDTITKAGVQVCAVPSRQ